MGEAEQGAAFDLGDLDYVEESTLEIVSPANGARTGWVWTFHGPASPASIAAGERAMKLAQAHALERDKARIEGREWHDPRSFDERADFNVTNLVMRVKSFSPIRLNGEDVTFSPDKAKALLLDRKRGWLLSQVSNFLGKDASFIKPSAQS